MTNLRSKLVPIDYHILPQIHDPIDYKLVEHVSFDLHDLSQADVIILGVPQDIGVLRNHGRIGARKGPDTIRQEFYKYQLTDSLAQLTLLDIGNIDVSGSLEDIHQRLYEVVTTLLKQNKHLIILGGGNDISYPDFKALASLHSNSLAINIDKHFDVRDLNPINSGTPYRYLLEEGYLQPPFFYEIAYEDYANSMKYKKYLQDKGVHLIDLESLRKTGILPTFHNIIQTNPSNPIFYGFDLDSINQLEAPGVSAPSITGLSSQEILKIASIAGQTRNTKILEITEYNPKYDLDNRTAKLASLLMYTYLSALAKTMHSVSPPLVQAIHYNIN